MALVYLGLGTNLGEKERNLNEAMLHINTETGQVIRQSSFYHSLPWGYASVNHFLNAVILINTHFTPEELLAELKTIERKMGRKAKTDDKYTDRIIDIDILLYENRIITAPGLVIPHPHIPLRDFVLIPFAEIAPEIIHPALGKTILELKEELILHRS